MSVRPTDGSARHDAFGGIYLERAGALDDWADFVARNLCHLDIRARREATFQVGARVRSAGEFMVARVTTVAGRAQLDRRRKEIRDDGQRRYAVYVPLQGEHELAQFDRNAQCRPRSMTLISLSEPFRQTKHGDNDTAYIFMPRDFVEQRLADSTNICGRAVGAQDGVQCLAHDALTALEREAPSMSQEEFATAMRLTGELFLLALAGAGDLMSGASSIRAASLARLKRVIRARLSDPDLTLEDVAGECGVSLRYLHDLFRDDGRTASEFLRCERLQRARRMLETSPAPTITEIGMMCGFSSPSQFATAFRRAYGISPRDARWSA